MKILKFTSFYVILVIALATFSSCGDKTGDPTPVKTDLELVQEGIVGTSFAFVKAEVTDGTEPMQTITDGCVKGKYENSVEDIVLIFNNKSNLTIKNKCGFSDYDYSYEITEDKGIFNLKIGTLVDATAEKNDIIDNDKIKSLIRIKFKETNIPAINWKYSPVIYFTKI